MNQKIFSRLFLCLLLLALVLPGCTKTGAIGPAGPAGATGAQGATGPKGDTGTANVIYSAWNNSFTGVTASWAVPDITQGVLDSAVVLVYVQQNTYVYQLPYDNVNGSGFYINDLLSVGEISLFCASSENLSNFSFRYVIIPGGVAADAVKQGYQTIANMFHLEP